MKKILIGLLVICVLLPVYAFADTEADLYLVDTPWKVSVDNFNNNYYMKFEPDGRGFMAIPMYNMAYEDGSVGNSELCFFTWNTSKPDRSTDSFADSFPSITIHFEGEFPGSDWGVGGIPYQYNTYTLIWHPDFMYLLDLNHSGIDAEGFNACKGIDLVRVDSIPFVSSSETGGYGAFGSGNGGGR